MKQTLVKLSLLLFMLLMALPAYSAPETMSPRTENLSPDRYKKRKIQRKNTVGKTNRRAKKIQRKNGIGMLQVTIWKEVSRG